MSPVRLLNKFPKITPYFEKKSNNFGLDTGNKPLISSKFPNLSDSKRFPLKPRKPSICFLACTSHTITSWQDILEVG